MSEENPVSPAGSSAEPPSQPAAGEGATQAQNIATPQNQPTPAATSGVLPPQHWIQAAQEEPTDIDGDGDSALGEDNASSTASITSTVLQYRTLHGRTYHSEQGNAQYWGSNDEPQNEVMDINHHTLTLGCGGKLFLAPLEKKDVKNVLDIGTGTGIWAIDFADEFPDAQVVGTDVSPIQPSWVPPNLRFEIEDCTRPWTFLNDSVDYVHMRWLVGSIRDWTALFAEAYRCCRPGGFVESYETSSILQSDDDTVKEDSAMGQWGKFFIEGSKKLGLSFTVVDDGTQRKAMEEAGFVDIEEYNFKNPLGSWHKDPIKKEMGRFAQFGLEKDSEGFVLFMAHTLGWTRDEILVYIAHLRREMRSEKHHAYYNQKVVWGRKPA